MKDFEGTEINVGDEVIQTSTISNVSLRRRKVVKVTEKSVTLDNGGQPLQAHQSRLDPNIKWADDRKRKYAPRHSVVTSSHYLFVVPKV